MLEVKSIDRLLGTPVSYAYAVKAGPWIFLPSRAVPLGSFAELSCQKIVFHLQLADLAVQEVNLRLAGRPAAFGAPTSARRELLLERLAALGEGAVVRPPFHCDYGFNISLGAGVFLNFNCVILDVVEVTIGDKTQIGPGVQILTADPSRP